MSDPRPKLLGAWLGLLLSLVFAMQGCSHSPKLGRPYLLISFPSLELFIEAEDDIGVVQIAEGSDLQLIQEPGFAEFRFQARGSGDFQVRQHQCSCREEIVVCDGNELGTQLGAVILRKDGRLEPANPLPLVAR